MIAHSKVNRAPIACSWVLRSNTRRKANVIYLCNNQICSLRAVHLPPIPTTLNYKLHHILLLIQAVPHMYSTVSLLRWNSDGTGAPKASDLVNEYTTSTTVVLSTLCCTILLYEINIHLYDTQYQDKR